ncbi:MAG TPA: DUF3429 domain-containing protein [Usitatibacter sp.]|nr:DUF3429 domain-containing protein [Usitatibacter sp.]
MSPASRASSLVRRLAWIFALAGLAIFAGLTVMLFSAQSQVRVPGIAALVTFAAVVLSYLGGVEGGLALRDEAGTAKTRAIAFSLSTLPSLAAWGVLWLPSPQWQLGAALALFVAVWVSDLWLARQGLVPSWFVDMRTAVTAVVAATLGVALYRV